MNTLKAEKRSMDIKAKKLRREGYVALQSSFIANVLIMRQREWLPYRSITGQNICIILLRLRVSRMPKMRYAGCVAMLRIISLIRIRLPQRAVQPEVIWLPHSERSGAMGLFRQVTGRTFPCYIIRLQIWFREAMVFRKSKGILKKFHRSIMYRKQLLPLDRKSTRLNSSHRT